MAYVVLRTGACVGVASKYSGLSDSFVDLELRANEVRVARYEAAPSPLTIDPWSLPIPVSDEQEALMREGTPLVFGGAGAFTGGMVALYLRDRKRRYEPRMKVNLLG